jgi:hypothetical protein
MTFVSGDDLVIGSFSQQIDTRLDWLPELSLFAFIDYGAV